MSRAISVSKSRFSKVLLGLPVPKRLVVASHWSITGLLWKQNIPAIEIHNFKVLLPELLSDLKYIVVIHADLMNLEDPANSDRALIINLAKQYPKNEYRIWDPKNSWIESGGMPPNLKLWTYTKTDEVHRALQQEI